MPDTAIPMSWPAARAEAGAASAREEDGVAPLVLSARRGDRDAFEALYRRFHRLVHGILLTRLPRADAEDVAQEVFLAAWERLDDLRDASGFGGWVAAIARNRATSHVRARREEAALPEDLPGGTPSEAGALAVLSAIRRLPEAYREPLVLRLVEGMTGPEIARQTGLTEGSVRVNLHRGFAKLREILGGSP